MSLAYEKYQQTEFEWLGSIPEQWEIVRIKDYTYLKARIGWQGMRSDEFVDNTNWHCVTGTDFCEGKIDWKNCYCISKERYDQDKKIQLQINDLLITKDGTIGKVALIDNLPKPTTLNSGVFVSRPLRKKYINEYMFWLLSSSVFTKFIDYNKNGSTILHLYQNVFERFFYGVPTISEQTQIANYLDAKTQALDKKIKLLSTKIEHYKELRKTIINDAVTKGLDKKVKLKKDVFSIPMHWNIKRLKDVFKTYTGNSIPDRSLYETKDNSRFYISTKDIDFDTGIINYDNGTYIQINDKTFKIAYANSTLICLEGASAGNKIGFTTKDICFVNKLCCVVGNENKISNKYFYYFTLSEAFKQQFFGVLNGMIGGVSMNLLKNFNIIFPPKQEQTEIATYLDAKTSTIDKITTNLQTQIQTLKELRKTLINDVVTGKVKVSNRYN